MQDGGEEIVGDVHRILETRVERREAMLRQPVLLRLENEVMEVSLEHRLQALKSSDWLFNRHRYLLLAN